MLYTCCPKCETTFRITEDALQQAEGQVRCGRCTNIFDARQSLTDKLQEPDPDRGGGSDNERPEARSGQFAALQLPGRAPAEETAERDEPSSGAAAAGNDAAGNDAGTQDSPPATGPDSDPDAAPAEISDDQVEAVLEATPPTLAPTWIADDKIAAAPRRTGLWSAAAAIAVVVLAAQLVHQYRGELARNEFFASLLQPAYALTGRSIVAKWDLDAYELLDWAAIEDTSGQPGQRNLIIRSRLRNNAPRMQPLPLIHLRLLDRWEQSVGARLFSPEQYGGTSGGMLRNGQVVTTELVIVDPGADAYGFELAVCLEREAGVVCDNDQTFR